VSAALLGSTYKPLILAVVFFFGLLVGEGKDFHAHEGKVMSEDDSHDKMLHKKRNALKRSFSKSGEAHMQCGLTDQHAAYISEHCKTTLYNSLL
jgi:hypothetical protein